MKLAISRVTNRSPKFYLHLGPYLSRRQIVRELGAPIWDEDDKEWFVAREKRRLQIVGFATMTRTGNRAHISSFWIKPEHRRKGAGAELLQSMLDATPDSIQTVDAIVTPAGLPMFRRRGFTTAAKRGRFQRMALTVGVVAKAS